MEFYDEKKYKSLELENEKLKKNILKNKIILYLAIITTCGNLTHYIYNIIDKQTSRIDANKKFIYSAITNKIKSQTEDSENTEKNLVEVQKIFENAMKICESNDDIKTKQKKLMLLKEKTISILYNFVQLKTKYIMPVNV